MLREGFSWNVPGDAVKLAPQAFENCWSWLPTHTHTFFTGTSSRTHLTGMTFHLAPLLQCIPSNRARLEAPSPHSMSNRASAEWSLVASVGFIPVLRCFFFGFCFFFVGPKKRVPLRFRTPNCFRLLFPRQTPRQVVEVVAAVNADQSAFTERMKTELVHQGVDPGRVLNRRCLKVGQVPGLHFVLGFC